MIYCKLLSISPLSLCTSKEQMTRSALYSKKSGLMWVRFDVPWESRKEFFAPFSLSLSLTHSLTGLDIYCCYLYDHNHKITISMPKSYLIFPISQCHRSASALLFCTCALVYSIFEFYSFILFVVVSASIRVRQWENHIQTHWTFFKMFK